MPVLNIPEVFNPFALFSDVSEISHDVTSELMRRYTEDGVEDVLLSFIQGVVSTLNVNTPENIGTLYDIFDEVREHMVRFIALGGYSDRELVTVTGELLITFYSNMCQLITLWVFGEENLANLTAAIDPALPVAEAEIYGVSMPAADLMAIIEAEEDISEEDKDRLRSDIVRLELANSGALYQMYGDDNGVLVIDSE